MISGSWLTAYMAKPLGWFTNFLHKCTMKQRQWSIVFMKYKNWKKNNWKILGCHSKWDDDSGQIISMIIIGHYIVEILSRTLFQGNLYNTKVSTSPIESGV